MEIGNIDKRKQMFWRYGGQKTSHGLDTHSSFQKKKCCINERWTDDGCLCHDSSSADKVTQSYKMKKDQNLTSW